MAHLFFNKAGRCDDPKVHIAESYGLRLILKATQRTHSLEDPAPVHMPLFGSVYASKFFDDKSLVVNFEDAPTEKPS